LRGRASLVVDGSQLRGKEGTAPEDLDLLGSVRRRRKKPRSAPLRIYVVDLKIISLSISFIPIKVIQDKTLTLVPRSICS
jgi:hypothetical protein